MRANEVKQGGFLVRPAVKNDRRSLLETFAAVVNSSPHYSDEAKNGEIANYQYLAAADAAALDGVLVVVRDESIVGFSITERDDGIAHLAWFGAVERERAKGVGTAALEASVDWARACGFHKIWCDSRTTNPGSIRLLERAGFEKVALFVNFWWGHDYFIWQKSLSE